MEVKCWYPLPQGAVKFTQIQRLYRYWYFKDIWLGVALQSTYLSTEFLCFCDGGKLDQNVFGQNFSIKTTLVFFPLAFPVKNIDKSILLRSKQMLWSSNSNFCSFIRYQVVFLCSRLDDIKGPCWLLIGFLLACHIAGTSC